MLRIIVISLVVANLLLLGFQSSKPNVQPETKPAVAVVEDSGIPTIHLFSEMMQDQGLMSGNRHCFTLGPFHSLEDRDDIFSRLQEVSTNISERKTEALVERGYWVYLPPFMSLLKANEALLSLQALGLEDVAVIYEGEWRNSVSLGYFMRQENAQRRKKALEDRGFNPKMRIQRQAEPRYWLDYEQEPGSGLIALDMRNRPNDFMQRPVPCPEADFLEADAVASQDTGTDLLKPQTTEEALKIAAAKGGDPDMAESSKQPTKEPEQQPAADAKDRTVAVDEGQAAGNTREKEQEASTGKVTDAAVDEAVQTQAVDEPEEASGNVAESKPGQAEAANEDNAAETPTEPGAEKATGDDVERTPGEEQGNTTDKGAETTTDQAETTGTEKPAEAPDVKEQGEATGGAVESAPFENSGNTTGSDAESAPAGEPGDPGEAVVESPPKQSVGTGPVDMVSVEKETVETTRSDQGAASPVAETSDNESNAGGDKPVDDVSKDTPEAPSGDTAEQASKEGTEKDSENGTG